MTKSKIIWYRKHMAPWGVSIGYYDECFIEMNGMTRSVHRHFENDRFKFYTFIRRKIADSGDRYVGRSRSWKQLLVMLATDSE